MNKVKSFFALMRWPNLLMIGLMMCLVYYCLMSPLFATSYQGITPAPAAFIFLLFAMIFIAAGGYVINDYFDVEIDKINKPDKLIVSRIFSKKETMIFYCLLTFIGLACAGASSYIALKSKFLPLFLCFVLLAAILYSYSYRFKRELLIGNIIVSLSVTFAVFVPWLFEILYLSTNVLLLETAKETMLLILNNVLIYCIFAFIMTMLREIVKDLEDFYGDLSDNCKTLPIVKGEKTAKIVSIVLTVCTLLLVLFYKTRLDDLYEIIPQNIMLIISFLCIVLAVNISKSDKKEDYHKISKLSKIIMLLGVLSMAFIKC